MTCSTLFLLRYYKIRYYDKVFIITERNIALGKWAKQSSNYKFDANKAIDGCTTRSWTKNCCTHTGNDFEPWWQLDLATQYPIGKVVIHRRFEESCWYSLFKLVLLTNKTPITSDHTLYSSILFMNYARVKKYTFKTIDHYVLKSTEIVSSLENPFPYWNTTCQEYI